jgi:putative Ca2+/H+ antiporter (TMEM165/GDT1 family)
MNSIAEGQGFTAATIHSFAVILVTEIGDKTFFIAAVLSMRYINSRIFVYAGAMGALLLMHVLSAIMGLAFPTLIPKSFTHYAAALLFAYFGVKLLNDSRSMDGDGPSDELEEVEQELIAKKGDGDGDGDKDLEMTEHGGNDDSLSKHKSPRKGGDSSGEEESSYTSSVNNWLSNYFTGTTGENIKILTQTCTLTFLAEWGDRSQIATVALAASKNVFGVVIGGLVGHALCTGVAVVGGRMLAAKISEKHVAIVGGVLFILFAIHAFFVDPEKDV